MAKKVDFEWTIPLTAEDLTRDLSLSILVDTPQIGSSILRKPSGEIINGEVLNESLGTGASLKGTTLNCKTLVTDIDKNSDKTRVNFQIGNYSIAYSEDVDQHGATILYKVTINFR